LAADLIGEKLEIPPPDMISALDVAANFAVPQPRLSEEVHLKIAEFSGAGGPSSFLLKAEGDVLFQNKIVSHYPLEGRDGGFTDSAIALYNLKRGYCSEAKLPSRDLRYEEKVQYRGFPFRKRWADDVLEPQDYVYKLVKGIEQEKGIDYPHSWECKERENLPVPILKLLASVARMASFEVAKELDRRCGERKPMPNLISESQFFQDGIGDSGLEQIAKILESGKSVGISYDVVPIRKDKKPGDRMNHASMVIGSRPGPEGCEYRIRNSWGVDCDLYEKVKDCGDGAVWVTEAQMREMVNGIDWIR
jgi:hypothetical protein